MTNTRVLIIGAGPSGLTALKSCLEEGITDVTIFEKSQGVGGLWRYEIPNGTAEVHSSVYKNTVINTSKETMSFSDFPIPATWPMFLHNTAVHSYFQLYADKFGLRERIRFNTEVVSVHPVGKKRDDPQGAGNSHSGKWEVDYIVASPTAESQKKKVQSAVFDKVIVASGHHWKPRYADFEGFKQFSGEKLHSHYYREAPAYKDKRCLVIGIGNSAVDVAVELSYHAKQTYVSTRTGAWIMSRFAFCGAPSEFFLSRAVNLLPLFITNILYKILIWLQWGHLNLYGLKPKFEPLSAHPTVNSDLPHRIATGTVIIKNNVRRFFKDADGQDFVEFEDGLTTQIDVVFLCTGYEIGYPFLDAQNILGMEKAGSNNVSLYKFVWPVHHENIAFLGLIQPLGAIMPISELQARWVAQVWTQKCHPLCDAQQRLKDVQKVKTAMSKRYLKSARHTIQVDAGTYMDELASQFGAKPPLVRLFFSDNYLWRLCVFGCWTPMQYRLAGPHPWDGARNSIIKSNSVFDYTKWLGLEKEIKIRKHLKA